ncbi:trypsin-like peptidase domain-containing protein [Saccharopolyspora sp. 5N708]|uniref:trypsin-like peptidase domain-containing protein n=1 Tax=Saccharopolyspora sp. 5N708 TaxID=3457424 RepID=UPI003FD469B6
MRLADGLGTAFFVAPGILVTCSHVLFDRAGGRIAEDVLWRGVSWRLDYARVVRSRDLDLAFISTDFGATPHVELAEDLQIGDQLYSYGYTRDFPDGDSLTVSYEGPTRDEMLDLKFKAGQVVPGMSGAALLNLRSGAVSGMVTRTRDRRIDLGGRGISASAILRELKAHQVPLGQAAAHEDRERIGRLLASLQQARQRRTVAGSRTLRFHDLLTQPGLLAEARGLPNDRHATQPISLAETVIAEAREETDAGVSSRRLVISPPGMGKSTLGQVVVARLTEQFTRSASPTMPILVDLRDYSAEMRHPDFATDAWLRALLARIWGQRSSAAGNWDSEKGFGPFPIFLVLDSLDELLIGHEAGEIQAVLGRDLFRRANLVLCRSDFFERYLVMTPFAADFSVVSLQPMAQGEVEDHVAAYYRMIRANDWRRPTADFHAHLARVPELKIICRVPLRLNMALDLFEPDGGGLEAARGLLTLYQQYVRMLLANEAAHVDSLLTWEEKQRLLKEVAWHFYDEGNMGGLRAPPFTPDELEQFLTTAATLPSRGNVARIAEDLRTRSLLTTGSDPSTLLAPGALNFTHKSFQEYLVTSYVFDTTRDDADRTAVVFRSNMSPEVSEFLKEYITWARESPRLLNSVAENMMLAYDINRFSPDRRCDQDNHVSPERARIARVQLSYYLGSIRLPSVGDFLRAALDTERDPLTRRSIALGFSFGGDSSFLDDYIAMLTAERRAGGACPENDVNIGFHLSLFGDQPLHPLHPDVDQGIARCDRTVARLSYQLETETDRGSWRLNLYTLVDLFTHRPVSHRSFVDAARENTSALWRAVARLRDDERCRGWPEIEAFAAVLHAVDEAQ